MRSRVSTLPTIAVAAILVATGSILAAPDEAPGCYGMRAGGGWNASHHDNIHALLADHAAIDRRVEEIDGGVLTVTTSDDPEITQVIREHVRQMQQRVENGRGMRWWDPLFVELFRNHASIRIEIEDVPGGVRVRETSDDPDVVLLIRQHAKRGVDEFVERGFDRAHEPTPLPDGYAHVAKAPKGDPYGCVP